MTIAPYRKFFMKSCLSDADALFPDLLPFVLQ